jgi:hypothetical protein
MASTTKPLYGTNNQAITITITSLANNGQRGGVAVDNTTNLLLDVFIVVIIKTNASGTSATGTVNCYVAGTADGGTNYTDGVTGTDASQTLTSPPNVFNLGAINAVANATTYVGGPWSLSGAFGGVIPDHWVLIVENKTSATLDASTGKAFYQGVQIQTV